jgi:DNA polymerase-1
MSAPERKHQQPECPEEIAEQVAALISREMASVAELKVPLLAEAKWGKSWFEAK